MGIYFVSPAISFLESRKCGADAIYAAAVARKQKGKISGLAVATFAATAPTPPFIGLSVDAWHKHDTISETEVEFFIELYAHEMEEAQLKSSGLLHIIVAAIRGGRENFLIW